MGISEHDLTSRGFIKQRIGTDKNNPVIQYANFASSDFNGCILVSNGFNGAYIPYVNATIFSELKDCIPCKQVSTVEELDNLLEWLSINNY